jgi:hypothetical protein
MTYDEKLAITIEAINEARQFTRKDYFTKLHIGTGNVLSRIPLTQLHDILLQLQDDDKIIKVVELPTELKPLTSQTSDMLDGKKAYFLIDVLEKFDDWLENYLMKQKTELANLDYINLLRIYDIVLDINEQIQLTNKASVSIHLLPPLVRFSALFPSDTIGMRDKYCENRRNSLKYLKEKGIIDGFDPNSNLHRRDTVVIIFLKLSKFNEFYKKIKSEYIKRNKTTDKDEKPKTENLKTDPKKVTYNPQKGELDIEGKKVKFKKESFRAKLLELLLKDYKSRKEEWSCDEVIEIIEGITDLDLIKEKQKKLYPACDGLTKHIASKIGVNDLLIFNKTTVRINPKYF